MKKINGSYYTSKNLADFVLEKSFLDVVSFSDNVKILEPSCGDGVFLECLDEKFLQFSEKNFVLDYVEKQSDELEKARKRKMACLRLKKRSYCQDFLDFQQKTNKQYDLIVGNPPYIYKNYVSDVQKEKCLNIHKQAGLSEKKIKNIWTSFFVSCERLLSPTGTLAFVLPAEFLSVKFCEEVRDFARRKFEKIEVYTFNELFFGDVGQNIIVFVGRKKSDKKGVFCAHIDFLKGKKGRLSRNIFVKDKWNQAVLSNNEIKFVKKLSLNLKEVGQYCESSTGIVTAANDYFIVDPAIINEFGLFQYSKNIIQKGLFVNGHMNFSKKDFDDLSAEDKPCYLLDFNGHDEATFSDSVKKYLEIGKVRKINERYKCVNRNRWFDIPSISFSEAFFFKRAHYYPKLLKNDYEMYVTDSAYRIKMKSDYLEDIDSFIFSYYNSLTLCLAELGGRYYGGGVLELTPNEFRSLKIPFKKISLSEFQEFKRIFNQKSSIEEVCQYTDRILLKTICGCTENDIFILRQIRQKLLCRRMKKSL